MACRCRKSKRLFWLASRNNMIGLLSQAGSSITIQGAGEWIAALPETERNQMIIEEPEVLKTGINNMEIE